jgi:hypothetical protein
MYNKYWTDAEYKALNDKFEKNFPGRFTFFETFPTCKLHKTRMCNACCMPTPTVLNRIGS